MLEIVLTSSPIEEWQATRLLRGSSSSGAVVQFSGIVRDRSKEGDAVETLFLDHHPRLTEPSMRRIGEEAIGSFALNALSITHRHGLIWAGETIVHVAAAAAHRRAAFDGAEHVMDRLKAEAIFWKREDSRAGSQWVEPTSADLEQLRRWA